MRTVSLLLKTIHLVPITGKVLNASKNMETKVSGSGGGGGSYKGTGYTNSVKISSQTIIHDQIFLQDSEGMEHSYQLVDFNLACREGNDISIIEAVKGKKQSGEPVCVMNHSTGKLYDSTASIRKVASPNIFLYLAAFIGIVYFMPKYSSGWIQNAIFIFIGFVICYLIVMYIQSARLKSIIASSTFR